MPYKDNDKQREAQRRSYRNRKDAAISSVKSRKARIRQWFLELKATKVCESCDEKHPACLEFHHKDREDKSFTISHGVKQGLSKETILAEIAKCQTLCSNCHQKVHWEEWCQKWLSE